MVECTWYKGKRVPDQPEPISEKIADAYEKYAPRNITLQEFAQMVAKDPALLDSIKGPFSTVNLELSKIFKKRKTKKGAMSDNDFRIKLRDTMNSDALELGVERYANMCKQIIIGNENILWGALTYDTLNRQQCQALAINIIESVNKYLGITDEVKVRCIDNKTQQSFTQLVLGFISTILIRLSNIIGRTNYRKIDWAGYQQGKEIVILKNPGFLYFMEILIHEYGHFIDQYYPDLGMLGAQVSYYSRKVYSSVEGREIYDLNPTEISSREIGEMVQKYVYGAIIEQIQKKPELYKKSIQEIISYKKVRLSALRIKYNNVLITCNKAEQAYQDLKNKILSEQHPGYQNLSSIEIAKLIHSVNQMPEVTTLRNKYQQIRGKIPDEIAHLEADIRHFEWILKQYDSDREYLMTQMEMVMDRLVLG